MSLRRFAHLSAALGSACLALAGSAATLFVDPASPTPTPPYDSAATAAHSIQEAIDAAAGGDTILVAPGTFNAGSTSVDGQLTRVAINKAVLVASQQGAAVTIIQGAGPAGNTAIRGVYVGANAVLQGFTIKDGQTDTSGDVLFKRSGGGVRSEASGVVRNCVLNSNRSTSGGGGAVGGTLVVAR